MINGMFILLVAILMCNKYMLVTISIDKSPQQERWYILFELNL